MRIINCIAVLALLMVSMNARLAFAQNAPALLVVPSKVTMLVGERHTFRAVDKDGHMRENVRWSVSPAHAATLTTNGDEATLWAREPSTAVLLSAYSSGDSAESSIEIRSGHLLPMGTIKWSVKELPGCKTVKIIPAVPTAGGPDIYAQELCPDGTYVRAILEDGRELWRRNIGGPGATFPSDLDVKEAQSDEHLSLSAHSFCDDVSSGMTKDAVSNLAQVRKLQLTEKERESDSWVIEENGSRCKILFDKAGAVLKKKKIISTD